jgi:hypothetical protein
LLRFARNDPLSCHCEERSDDAISIRPIARCIDPAILIEAIDEIDLLLTRAGLYLLFPRDGAGRIVSRLIIDELGDVVALRKSRQNLLSMLVDTRPKIASDAGIEHCVALVGQDIGAVHFFHTSSLSLRVSHRPAADPP